MNPVSQRLKLAEAVCRSAEDAFSGNYGKNSPFAKALIAWRTSQPPPKKTIKRRPRIKLLPCIDCGDLPYLRKEWDKLYQRTYYTYVCDNGSETTPWLYQSMAAENWNTLNEPNEPRNP